MKKTAHALCLAALLTGLCLSATAFAQGTPTKREAATLEAAPSKQAKGHHKNTDLVLNKAEFGKLNKGLAAASYTTMGKLAKADPAKVAAVIRTLKYDVVDKKKAKAKRSKASSLKSSTRERVTLGIARELIERAGTSPAATPMTKGTDKMMGHKKKAVEDRRDEDDE